MVASADVTTGFAPLTVTYTIANQGAGDGSFTFDGAGPFAVPAGASVSLSVTYPQGVFDVDHRRHRRYGGHVGAAVRDRGHDDGRDGRHAAGDVA